MKNNSLNIQHSQSLQHFQEQPLNTYEKDVETDQTLVCAKCHNSPDDLLILTCDHNLCLMCASKNLQRESKKAAHSFQTVVCEMCEIATVLDPASATELLSMYPTDEFENKNSKKNQQQNSHNPFNVPQNDNYQNQQVPLQPGNSNAKASHQQFNPQMYQAQPNYLQSMDGNESMRRNLRPEKDQCREHPDEEVNYFCFDCLVPPVCSECVVHGVHRGHNVATVRKAYPQVMAKVEELGLNINSKIDELHLQSQRLESRKREVIDQTNAIKQQMANSFEELRQRLDKKEREMMINADSFMEKNLSEVESFIRLINGRCINLNSTVDMIRHATKSSDDVGLMNYYALNHQKILQSALDSDLPQLKEIPKQVNLKCDVDIQSLNRFIEEIEGLQLAIAALDGDILDDIVNQTLNQAQQPNKNPKSQQFKKQAHPSYQQDKYQNQQLQQNFNQRQQQQPVQSVFDLAYRQKNPFQQSVAATMNKLAEHKYGNHHVAQSSLNHNQYSHGKNTYPFQQQTPPQQDSY
eukprot:403367782